ncbi:arginine N-methyltransferas-like protein [Saccharata proteae CBS 121410]|uniref:Protein arginine N-methyltransferase n=1 Tax=Saccharata proteae CBS 121410 TaxID=1314787 RepID=A0A6A5YAT7_9PEZI|nr:arginine N-methyltransferas-like protein [Saccharata proteae CBS 121410]
MDDNMPTFFVGQHESNRAYAVTDHLLHHAQDCNYDMLTAPITTSQFHTRVLHILSAYNAELELSTTKDIPLPLIPPLAPTDTHLTPNDTVARLLALTSSWIDLASPDPLIAHVSRQVLTLEIAYAAFCGVQNIIIKGPKLHHGDLAAGSGIAQYARAILEALGGGPYIQVHIMLPMADDPQAEIDEMGDLAAFAKEELLKGSGSRRGYVDMFGTWDAWNVIRTVCKYSAKLSVALTIPKQLPPMPVQNRWFSEPLRILSLPESSFVKNKKGYPVLPVGHQALIHRYMRLRNPPWLILSDVGPIPGLEDPDAVMSAPDGVLSPDAVADTPEPTPAEASQWQYANSKKPKDPTPHLSYIRYLQKNQPAKSMLERFATGYQDFLQTPLQPLADNLESITYETFEQDPIKYQWYEAAIDCALRDWMQQKKSTSSPNGAVVIAVAGSGRGPLVTRALNAAENTGVKVEVWAVEKNQNAYVLLQRTNAEVWNNAVTVVKTDMRFWKGPHRPDGTHGHVDILVSELLGSFADNELSPECLDGVQHVLNPTHGISIPSSYTAHMTPIAAPKLYADVQARAITDPTTPETPSVVMLHAIDFLSTLSTPTSPQPTADVKLVWQFSHPLPPSLLHQSQLRRGGGAGGGAGGATGGDGANEHNARFSRLGFHVSKRGECHGLAGYFETVLYAGPAGTVELSTNPNTMDAKSRDMISWFPIFFPLKSPMYLPDDSDVEVSIWRQTDDRKVWYEWLVEAFITVQGRRVRLAVSDLHSSVKNGCLM